jgi:HAD superfamily phosphoserine phosphatase-like hydrolase
MTRVYLCDFDGTVAPSDIGAAFARAFSSDGLAEAPAFLARWRAGTMGHRELTVEQCRLLSVTREEALAFTRGFGIDPAFPRFVRAVEARGDRVAVVSEGFHFYVADQLQRAGLGHVPFSANTLRFAGRSVTPEFPEGGCGACGNCKGRHVAEWRARGFRTVLVGDGLSDRCGARGADAVFARRDLLDWCRREGVAARPFASFADLLEEVAGGDGARPSRSLPSASPADAR